MKKFRSHFCIGEISFTIVSDVNETTVEGQQIAQEIYTEVEKFALTHPIFRDSFEPTNFAIKDLQMLA